MDAGVGRGCVLDNDPGSLVRACLSNRLRKGRNRWISGMRRGTSCSARFVVERYIDPDEGIRRLVVAGAA